jgi:AcrR family transcriptional regulator
MARPNQREMLLDAAEAIVAARGAAHLTLEAVAAEAGVSKGGLLYHFRAKEELLRAMVERYLHRRLEEKESTLPTAAAAPRDYLAAHVRRIVGRAGKPAPRLQCALLAAIANDPGAMAPVQRHVESVLNGLRAGFKDDAAALTLYFAAEGLLHHDLLQLQGLKPAERRRLQEYWLTETARLT